MTDMIAEQLQLVQPHAGTGEHDNSTSDLIAEHEISTADLIAGHLVLVHPHASIEHGRAR
eukprot:gene3026-13051_t